VASYITAGKEKAFATMVASLVYYGKKVKGLDFTYLSPMNEQDWNCLEGPCVDTTQYTAIMHEIADELNYMGIGDVRFAGPDTADSGAGMSYISKMMADNTVAGLTDHLAFHDYSSTSISPGTSYTGKNYWLSETSAWCSECDAGGSGPTDEWSFATQTTDLILGDINNGFAAVLLWEAYDSFWYHHNASSLWGLLAYNPVTGIYTPRKRAYAYAHFNHFIEPGDIVIGSSESISSVPTTVAVYNATSGKIAIVGRNSGNSAITITGQLSNLPTVNTLALYETNSSVNLSRKSDISVTGGIFTAQISADSIFTLTNRPVAFNLGSPNDLLTISLVQKASNTSASALSLATTFPSPVTTGNLIVVSVSGWPNLPAAKAVTDSLGNTYSIADTILVSEGTYSAIYYAKNIAGGTDTITFKTVKSGGHISMAVAEFSGVDTVSPLDMTSGTIGSGTAPSSGTMTPSLAGELVIGSGTHNGTTVTTAGSGFTMIAIPTEDSATHQPLAMGYQVLSGSQSVSATFNLGTSYRWIQNGALFKPAAQQYEGSSSPTIVITAPQNNATVSGAVLVSAMATDNIAVTRVEFYLDGVLQSSKSTAPYEWYWDSLQTTNGSHTLMVRVYDATSAIITSPDVLITVANARPVTNINMVQKTTNTTTSAQKLSSTLPSPVTAGNFIVVSISGGPNLPAAKAVTDSLGNTYSLAGPIQISQGSYNAIYYTKTIKGGADTVTFRTVKAGGQILMVVAEVSSL
jgi:O-glycosyl hydrolase